MKKTVILLICALLAGGSAVQAQRIVKTTHETIQVVIRTETELSRGVETLLTQELIRLADIPATTNPYIMPEIYRSAVPDTRTMPNDGVASDSRYTLTDPVTSSYMTRRALQNISASTAWDNQTYKGPDWCLRFICRYQDENPDLCFQAGVCLMDYYWNLALHIDSSYWAWSAYLRENLRGKLRDKALDAITRMEKPALTRAMASDNYNDCAYFCTMYPSSSNFNDIFSRYKNLLKRDSETDTLGLIAGQYSHKDSALVILNNVTYGTAAIHTTLLDKTSGEQITTMYLTPCSDATQVAIPTGKYTIALEYTTDSIDRITDTIELDAKQYVYNVQIFIDEEDVQLHELADAMAKTICEQEHSLIYKKYNSIRNRRVLKKETTEEIIDSLLTRSHRRNTSFSKIQCGPVDMTGANIGTTLITQNFLLSIIPKKNDRFIVYTIPANDDSSHAPIIVAAPCNPSTPYEVEQREQALRTLNFFLAADTMDNPKQHGTIHFVFYKRNEYLHQIGDLFKGKPDSPQVALAIDEWVSDTINVESPESQGSVTFTPPVPQVKTDYGHTDLPHALYHICPAMVGALPESIYSALR